MADESKNILQVTYSDNIFRDAGLIIEQSRDYAYRAVNVAMIQRNWMLGKRIADEELKGENRAEYGKEVVMKLADFLTKNYGKGFDYSSLYKYIRFYKAFPQILDAASTKSLSLTWTHYRELLRVTDDKARNWYMNEAIREGWSSRTLDRNIASQYYYRLLQSQTKDSVHDEMEALTADFQHDKLEFIKNPVVAEFLGLSPNNDFTETKLEASIITHSSASATALIRS